MDEIYEQLTAILRSVFRDDSLIARPGMTAADVAGWDSLAHAHLIMAVEERFKIEFSTSQIAALQSLDDLAQAIRSKQ